MAALASGTLASRGSLLPPSPTVCGWRREGNGARLPVISGSASRRPPRGSSVRQMYEYGYISCTLSSHKSCRPSVEASAAVGSAGEGSGCPVMPVGDGLATGVPPISGLGETLLRVISVILPAAACIYLLPQTAPEWLKAICAAGASVFGLLATGLAEKLYWKQQYSALSLPHTVQEGKHPLLSHLPKIFGGDFFLNACREKYGEVFSMSLPLLSRHPVPVIYGGTEVRQLLSEENTAVISSWPSGVVKLLGSTSLLALQGKQHQRLRQVMGEVLNDTMIYRYGLPITLEMMDKAVANWCKEDEVAMFDEARNFTMQVSISFILGFSVDDATFKELRKDFDIYTKGLFAPDWGLPFGLFHYATKARGRMCAVFAKTFREWLPKYREGTAQKGALYSCVQEAEKEGLTADVDYICDQLIMLLFAGTETTATSLTAACLLLTSRRDVMEKLVHEVKGLQPEEIANPSKAPYTRAVANEILRVKPPVQRVFRKTLRAVELHGKTIPAGWTVMLSVGPSSTASVSEPEEFSPERWLDTKKLPESFIPFGHGVRVCPGRTLAMSELHAMLGVLANYNFTVTNMEELPKEGPPMNMKVAFSPCGGEGNTSQQSMTGASP